MIQIRRATVNDSMGIARVQVDSYRTAYAGIFSPAYLEHFTDEEQAQDWYDWMMNKPRDLLYVSQSEAGEIVGYALGRPGKTAIQPYDCELLALHVRQDFQQQGIGQSLIIKMAEQFQAQGCNSMMLWVLSKNPARVFYEKLGGTLIGEQEVEVGEGEKAVQVAYGWADLAGLLV
jgi:ribosomal protein S18 acetylase RimI-like enzyme